MRPPVLAHLRFAGILTLTGVMAGLAGAACHWVLHSIEHAVWGKGGLGNHTLIEGAMYTTPQYRFILLILAGLVGALSWGVIVRTGTIPRISQAMSGGRMPVLRTLWHSMTQIVIVALGASAGREAAPREITSALGARMGDYWGLDARDRRIVVGSAAGAGLAAVYAIPLSGVFFTLEVMLLSHKLRAFLSAGIVNIVAVLVASGGQPLLPFYEVPSIATGAPLYMWALIGGPLLGAFGVLFRRGIRWAESRRPETLRLTWQMPVTFLGVGLLAAFTPTVLGNGQASAQTFLYADHYMMPGGLSHLGSVDPRPFEWLGVDVLRHFNSGATMGLWASLAMILALTVAKAGATMVTIHSGAWGGTLTPSLAVGAGVAAFLGLAWEALWPGIGISTYVVVGASAFLGVALNAPITGMFLLIEFTRSSYDLFLAMALAAVMAQVSAHLIEVFSARHHGPSAVALLAEPED